ncbi:MAG TPA: PilZ domain-containing protein, partial [Polyangia bacterium]
MDERRRETRRPVDGIRVRVRFADRRQLEQCWLKDISQGGIFLRSSTPKPRDTAIEVVLALPDASEVTLHGTIVHVVAPEQARPGHPAGLGVAFSDLTAEVRATLASFVEKIDSAAAIAPLVPESDRRAARPAPAPYSPWPDGGRPTSSFP